MIAKNKVGSLMLDLHLVTSILICYRLTTIMIHRDSGGHNFLYIARTLGT